MKKIVLILGGSSSIALELSKLHLNDIVYYSYHLSGVSDLNAFYLDLYDVNSYENIPLREYDVIYSFLGYTPDVLQIEDIDTSRATIERNFLFPTLLFQRILQSQRVKTGTRIKIVTSVAGIRGRQLNYVYGASKAALQTLIEGLANRYPEISFTDIVLGPVYTTAVSKHNTPNFLVSNPNKVAVKIFRANQQKVYVPFRWRLIMFIIRNIPIAIYNKLKV